MTHPPHHRGWLVARVVVGIVCLIVGSLVAAFALRDPLASMLVARGFRDAGLECDHLAVHVPGSLPLTTMTLAPMRCTAAAGPLASIRFLAPLQVAVDGAHARSVSCRAIDVDLRAQHRNVALSPIGDVSHVVGLDQPGVDLVLDWAALAPRDLPPFTARHAVIRRAGRRAVELEEMHLWPVDGGQAISAAAAHVDQVAVLGAATLHGRSTPARTVMTLVFGGHLRVDLTGTRLASSRPNVDFAVSL